MKKGYQYEWQLIQLLKEKYFCVRIAGSGNNSPDIVVLKNGRGILIEVKKGIYKRKDQDENFKKIKKKYNLEIIYAFKIPYKGWLFEINGKLLNLEEFEKYLQKKLWA
jgi:Holliday junction resolvase